MRDDEMVNFEPAEYMREMFFSFCDTGRSVEKSEYSRRSWLLYLCLLPEVWLHYH